MLSTLIREWFPLIVVGFNAALFIVIKFNDISHISVDIKSIKEILEKNEDKLDNLGQRISKIEGKCNTKKECD